MVGKSGLDRDIGSLRETDIVLVGFFADEQSEIVQLFYCKIAGRESIHTVEVVSGQGIEGTVGIEDIEDRKVVAPADFEVQLVVSGSDFQDAGAEFAVDGFIRDNGEFLLGEGTPDFLADEAAVTLVLRVDCDGSVAHEGFRAGCGNFKVLTGLIDQFITHFVEQTLLRLHDYLFIAQGSEAGRTPVDHAFSPVNVTALVEFNKGGENGAAISLVHGEDGTIPIAGSA